MRKLLLITVFSVIAASAAMAGSWIINPNFPGDSNAYKIQTDDSGFIYVYGGYPDKIQKYSPEGALLWSLATTMIDSTLVGSMGSLVVDSIGNSYLSFGVFPTVAKIDNKGQVLWYRRTLYDEQPNEKWCIAYDRKTKQLISAGGGTGGYVCDINPVTGGVNPGIMIAPGNGYPTYDEVRAITTAPNNNFYCLTNGGILKNKLIAITPSFAIIYSIASGYELNYEGVNVPHASNLNLIRASKNFLYTSDGSVLDKRNISTGKILRSTIIPYGVFQSNDGIIIDSCGNVYVGSQRRIYRYDADLKLLDSVAVPDAVYDLAFGHQGEILSCGHGFIASVDFFSQQYGISPSSVNLGITNVGETKSGKALFRNQTTSSTRINNIHFTPSSFGTIITQFPKTLAGGDSLEIEFTVTATDTFSYQGYLCITIDQSCVGERCIPVKIEGASMCLSPLTTNTVGKRPGDEITIPILLEPSTKFVTAKEMDITVTYDPTLLRFVMATSSLGKVSQVNSPDGEVSFTLTLDTALPTPGATIAELHTQALLAPYVEGKIEITQSSITLESGEKIAGRNCPSTFTLDSSCVMPHLLKKKSTAEITGLYPNPSRNTVTLEVIAHNEPDVRIEVYDTFGRRVMVVHDGKLDNGTHDVTINTEHYSTGIYLCRLVCNGQITTKAFTVEK